MHRSESIGGTNGFVGDVIVVSVIESEDDANNEGPCGVLHANELLSASIMVWDCTMPPCVWLAVVPQLSTVKHINSVMGSMSSIDQLFVGSSPSLADSGLGTGERAPVLYLDIFGFCQYIPQLCRRSAMLYNTLTRSDYR